MDLSGMSWLLIALAVMAAGGLILLSVLRRKAERRRRQRRLDEAGRKGEEELYERLLQLKGYRKILQNVYIPTSRSTTEADLIMLHHSGIYVFENKAYSGWIFGTAESQYWMQTRANGTRNSFYNPIRQNEGHIHSLMKLLGVKDRELFHSVVVFSDKAEFREVDCEGRSFVNDHEIWVIHLQDLYWALKKAGAKTRYSLTRGELRSFYQQLLPCTKVSGKVKQQHIKDVKRKYKR